MGSPTNILSLCAGIGGLDLGIHRAIPSARTICFVEREAFAIACLEKAMRTKQLADAPIWSDLTSFDGTAWRGCVDIVAAGFPCQDISTAGKRAGIKPGTRSGLWFHVARIIGECQPEWVFLENVAAIRFNGLDVVLESLAEIGFDAEWCTIPATACGATTRRERWFMLAHANRIDRKQEKHRQYPAAVVGQRDEVQPVHRCSDSGGFPSSWPPIPADTTAYAELTRTRPDLSPCYFESDVRGVVAGFPDWMDRTRALGNAVIPAQAEHAFRLLFARF